MNGIWKYSYGVEKCESLLLRSWGHDTGYNLSISARAKKARAKEKSAEDVSHQG